MEHGDLTVVNRPTIVVILEGVLAHVSETEDLSQWSLASFVSRIRSRRENPTYTYEITWLDVPVKRLATMMRSYDVDFDVVTFTSTDVADDAAEFFNDIGLYVSTVSYHDFEKWARTLPFMQVQQIIDSNQRRLDRYGQLGRSVTMGEDW